MSPETYAIIRLILIVIIALSIFVITTKLTGGGLLDSIRFVGRSLKEEPRKMLIRWRCWRDPQFNHWYQTSSVYLDAILFLMTLVDNEAEAHREKRRAETAEEKDLSDRVVDFWSEVKVSCTPMITEQLVKYNDDDLRIVAQVMTGFTYDCQAATEDWEQLVELKNHLALLQQMQSAIRAEPRCLLVQINLHRKDFPSLKDKV